MTYDCVYINNVNHHMSSKRKYPEPINTLLKYTFYIMCYLSRVWVYPNPLERNDPDAADVVDWTYAHYNAMKRAYVDYFDVDHERFFKRGFFTSLQHILTLGTQVYKYEQLHRIRWKRITDETAYNDAKTLGFWTALFEYMGKQ